MTHFFHAAQIAVITIAIFANRNVKLKLVIAFIGLRPTQIPGKARAAHHNAAKAVFLDIIFRDHADIGVALLENPVFCQHRVNVLQYRREGVGPFFDVIDQSIWQILMHPARAKIGRMQTRTASPLIKDHQLFALFKSPSQWRHRPHIHRLCGHIEQMVEHAANFRIEHPDQAGAARHDGAGELLNRQTPSVLLIHRSDIIKPIKIGQVLQISPAFHQLFCAAVQQPNMRIAALDNLAVQFQHQPQHTMRGRMLWTEVDIEITNLLLAGQSVVKFGAVHYAPPSWPKPWPVMICPIMPITPDFSANFLAVPRNYQQQSRIALLKIPKCLAASLQETALQDPHARV